MKNKQEVFTKGQRVQFVDECDVKRETTVVEGPYLYAFNRTGKREMAYSVQDSQYDSIKILQAKYMSLAPVKVSLEAELLLALTKATEIIDMSVKGLLCYPAHEELVKSVREEARLALLRASKEIK